MNPDTEFWFRVIIELLDFITIASLAIAIGLLAKGLRDVRKD